MRYLGIDFGTKRVGIALSDEDGKMAFPKEVIENSPRLLGRILDMCIEENVGAIVIGESKDLDGTRNPLMKKIEVFVDSLRTNTKIPVFFEPEFFTSHQAQKIQGKNAMIDASAAAIILQSFIDKRANAKHYT